MSLLIICIVKTFIFILSITNKLDFVKKNSNVAKIVSCISRYFFDDDGRLPGVISDGGGGAKTVISSL